MIAIRKEMKNGKTLDKKEYRRFLKQLKSSRKKVETTRRYRTQNDLNDILIFKSNRAFGYLKKLLGNLEIPLLVLLLVLAVIALYALFQFIG